MTLTREQAEQICEEARLQGWEADKRMVPYERPDGTKDEYNEGRGRVRMFDWDQINRQRAEIGNDPVTGSGCTVELIFPGWEHPKYWLRTTDEWRQLKSKVDEIKEIVNQLIERGWDFDNKVVKSGKFGIALPEVYPPGYQRPYGVRIGGMRTWRKLCREIDNIIEAAVDLKELPRGAS